MRIAIVALGTLGDITPCIALGQGLASSGDEVKIVTFRRFESLVKQHGLAFHAVNRRLETFLERDLTQFHVTAGTVIRALRRMPQTKQEMQQQLEDLMRDCLEAFADVDLVLGQAIAHLAAWPIAQQLALPYYAVCYAPLHRTRAFPNAFAGNIFPSGPGWHMRNKASYNWWTHTISGRVFWSRMHTLIQNALHTVIEQPVLYLNTDFPVLYGYSPQLLPKPREWAAHITVTGYWQVKHPEDWQPPADLAAFLQAGSPPVYIGFGSIHGQSTRKVIQLAIQAIKALQMRCILLMDSKDWPEFQADENIFFLRSAPHSWLFPRMATIVHHGGAGTTATALYAGIPQIIVPFIADQSFWGHFVAVSGVGPKPLLHKTMRAEHIQSALAQTVNNADIHRRAQALSEVLHSEDGVACAIEAIHAYMQTARHEDARTFQPVTS